MVKRYILDQMGPKEVAQIHRRSEIDISRLRETVRPILDAVREQGDEALIRFTREFDKVDIAGRPIEATEAEFAACGDLLSPEVRGESPHYRLIDLNVLVSHP